MLPGLVLDTTGPDHLSVRETGEMADRRTASAAVTFRYKEFVLGMLQPSTIWAGARSAHCPRLSEMENFAQPKWATRQEAAVKPLPAGKTIGGAVPVTAQGICG